VSNQLADWMRYGAALLTTNQAAWAVSFAILFVGLGILYLRFIPKCQRLRRDLWAAIGQLSGIKNAAAFAAQYESISTRISKSRRP